MRIPCDASLHWWFSIEEIKEMKTTGIYMITNNINKKVYIGQSVCIERRIPEHLRAG